MEDSVKEPVAQTDEVYEFSAPRFFDFLVEETEDEIRNAENWFERGISYAQSPFPSNVKARKSYKKEKIFCNLGEIEERELFPSETEDKNNATEKIDAESESKCVIQEVIAPGGDKEVEIKEDDKKNSGVNKDVVPLPVAACAKEEHLRNTIPPSESDAISNQKTEVSSSLAPSEAYDAKTPSDCRKIEKPESQNGSRNKSAKKIASIIKNHSSMKPRAQKVGSIRSSGLGGDVAQENQAIKRQKLEGGLSRQIHSVKNRPLIHKSKPDLPPDEGITGHNKKEEILRRPILTLTRPKEPELETAHRVRAIRVKSSAELEEEMLSKIPKFRARPINRKILQPPSMPTHQRSIPQPPEFQEERHHKMRTLTEPKMPVLETSLRARPPRIKSSQELELEELEKIPKFKARPLSKRIFEPKEDRVVINPKPKITIPQEFHFATNDRLGAPIFVFEAFDKMSLHSEGKCEKRQTPKLTVPNPFHLHTEERGLEKERDLTLRIQRKEMEEEKARVPKANPYPYTTDYPIIPPKPAPKECTKPEGFQLESVVRHEEVMQMKMEELERLEREEAKKRIFKAQPILTNRDPFPPVKRERKPLTEVQGFDLHVDHRATERSEFDKKIKEKETMYKRLREENETAKKIEEEREVKQMRKAMVPIARPLPNFINPFHPQKSTKEITKPKSPALKVAMRLMMRRQQLNPSPASSLFQMR